MVDGEVGIELVYPTAPLRLTAPDMPTSELSTTVQAEAEDGHVDAWAWWQTDHLMGDYTGLELGLDTLGATLKDQGPFTGVIGFSQGAAAAVMLAALLEPGRPQAFEELKKKKNPTKGQVAQPNVVGPTECIDFPSSITRVPGRAKEKYGRDHNDHHDPMGEEDVASLIHPPLKFVVAYCGFKAARARYAAFYDPPIATPVLHFVGQLDVVVEPARTLLLVDVCSRDHLPWPLLLHTSPANPQFSETMQASDELDREDSRVVYHPGGHFVPSQKPYLNVLVRFMKDILAVP